MLLLRIARANLLQAMRALLVRLKSLRAKGRKKRSHHASRANGEIRRRAPGRKHANRRKNDRAATQPVPPTALSTNVEAREQCPDPNGTPQKPLN